MGLDMYFYLNRYDSRSKWDDEKLANDGEVSQVQYPKALKSLEDYIYDRNFMSVESKYQVGYFRKFNALHAYIVDNFANGVDECQEIEIDETDLQKMLNDLVQVDNDHSKAEELLPTRSGFFFGGTEYDDWYFSDVKDAIKMIKLIMEVKANNKEYYLSYRASW